MLDALPAAIKQHPGYSNDAATAALASIDGIWDELFYPFVRAMVHQLVERITIGTASIKIALSLEGLGKAVLSLLPGGSSTPSGRWERRPDEQVLGYAGQSNRYPMPYTDAMQSQSASTSSSLRRNFLM